ncbi:hypothetical protein K402DRAFT_329937 [Aulographum hederae CBS 113979]|uniref:Bromo domain-containing protein n=1 Tax=Aulographum hederae CBS 113979 TaxID=1176131 RepID=A0A6G1H3I3_9PEZI|nr:hypothetical protein K402DRAFT_329937 [Aulographum hederae CBS 113979]
MDNGEQRSHEDAAGADSSETAPVVAKKNARTIDEDDYGDEDDEEEEDITATSAQLAKPAPVAAIAPGRASPSKPVVARQESTASEHAKAAEDVRKKLMEDKDEVENNVKRNLHTFFHTLESDRDAMVEQQKLDELDRQVEAETSGQAANSANAAAGPVAPQGTLSTANLGASNLALKHLFAKIDAHRGDINATETQLRQLIKDVRKNRSKWSSDERVGQEELYEAAEKVLESLKAQTEYATPFLNRVAKREAPDYHVIIKHPMDIGTMLKKLKTFQYKSKKDFVDDLYLIWSNCLKYNADPAHPLRRKAIYMRKQSDDLTQWIPDIVVRDRADVEAEERRMANVEDADGAEESDDEEPIMASRGRKAPKKGVTTARKAPAQDDSPAPDVKPIPASKAPGSASNLKNDFLRADSDAPMEGSQNGFTTPPPGSLTPLGAHGIFSSGAPGSQADASDLDGTAADVAAAAAEEPDVDDLEHKTWKQLTKKARARAATDRSKLFRGNGLNPDEAALLRSKAGMRRWMRQQQLASNPEAMDESAAADGRDGVQALPVETLAEGMEEEEDPLLPDYYDPMSAIPDLNPRLKWVEDSEGQVIAQAEECLRVVPKELFKSPQSNLTRKMEANMSQMQDTRRICAKIGIVKQMQLQSQTYQNQFQKYETQTLIESDIDTLVVSDDGPVISTPVCRAALQRSVGKIFYHAGFEEFQPSALDAVTELAGDFFKKLVRSLKDYQEAPMVRVESTTPGEKAQYKPRFSDEEMILHCLNENGLDVEALDGYVKDDVDRLGSKLGVMHDRMRSHLADLLRPALDPNAGADGAGAFNDGSDQFVGGDFAEDIGEDFFGLRESGIMAELGLDSVTVPLHLLQNRMHTAFQAQNPSAVNPSGTIMEPPPPWDPIAAATIPGHIGLVHDFFLSKIPPSSSSSTAPTLPATTATSQPSADNVLVIEDDDLPIKQRFPKPRLPPTGKITSPRKRPIREQQQMAKKKRKAEEMSGVKEEGGATEGRAAKQSKLRLEVPSREEEFREPEKDGQKDKEREEGGLISPESM